MSLISNCNIENIMLINSSPQKTKTLLMIKNTFHLDKGRSEVVNVKYTVIAIKIQRSTVIQIYLFPIYDISFTIVIIQTVVTQHKDQ